MFKKLKKSKKLLLPLILLALVACDKPQTPKEMPNAPTMTVLDELVGCYTITKNTPAQIKISQSDGKYTMQMKEPSGATRAWDNPEPLENLGLDKVWAFFKANTLDLQQANLSHALVRPDGMMALAKLDAAVVNVNPLLDSQYVVHIFQDVSTIYQVPCDDVPLDMVKSDFHQVHGH